ncbi:hypothetical protein Trydic_g13961 [Trypoxylus dichotomus]
MEVIEDPSLHYSQHAYRGGRSSETALLELTGTIQKTLDEGQTAICAFLNISGAFDNTSHEAVRQALEKRRVNKTVSRWLSKVSSTRTAEVTIGEETMICR